jgi:hypothetical protein
MQRLNYLTKIYRSLLPEHKEKFSNMKITKDKKKKMKFISIKTLLILTI